MAKILIVEDNPKNRDMLSRRLIKRGYEIVMAEDGQEGIDMTTSESPDLILLDMGPTRGTHTHFNQVHIAEFRPSIPQHYSGWTYA